MNDRYLNACVLFCLLTVCAGESGAAEAASTKPRAIRIGPIRRGTPSSSSAVKYRSVEQRRENDKWFDEAVDRARSCYQKAERCFRKRDYRNAKKYYLKTVGVRYKRWVFRSDERRRFVDDDETRVIDPTESALRKEKRALETAETRLARERLEGIDLLIDRQDLADMTLAAEKAYNAKKLGKAYQLLEKPLKLAMRMGTDDVAADHLRAIRQRREEIQDEASRMVVAAEAALKANAPAEALDALDKLKAEFSELRGFGALRQKYAHLNNAPQVRAERRERRAMRYVAQGDAVAARKRYSLAIRRYRSVAKMFADTRTAKLAREKLDKLARDPEVARAIQLQKAESECKALLARARAFLRMKKPDEARAACERIASKYPDTEWAAEAAKIMDGLAKTKPAERATP